MKTLKELKDFLNTLNDEQLTGEIVVAGDDDAGLFQTTITGFAELSEDYFVSDEGSFPISDHEPELDEPLEECPIIKAGTVYLYQS